MDSFYAKYHLDAQKEMEANRLRAKENHKEQYPDLENMLGFQHYLHTEFAKFYFGSQHDKFAERYSGEVVADLYFHSNVLYLQTALHSLECDLIHPCSSHLRTVHEAIPKMYYMSLYSGEVWDILESETPRFGDKTFPDFISRMRAIDAGASPGPRNPESDADPKPRDLYWPGYFRRSLYEGDRKKAIDQMYDGLSSSVHPSTVQNLAGTSYNRDAVDLFFGFMKTLSYFNTAAYLEFAVDILHDILAEHETTKFLNDAGNSMKTVIGGAYFFPNKGDLASRLKHPINPGAQ